MNCTEFMVELTDLLDERLDRALRAELDEHMLGCDHCKVVFVCLGKSQSIAVKDFRPVAIARDDEGHDFC